MTVSADYPSGVELRRLETHSDSRGALTEIFRASWFETLQPVQWNVVTSVGRVMRGVHVHHRHTDYLLVLSGSATIGLRDLRAGSRTLGWSGTLEMSGDAISALVIPPGVAHGFYFPAPAIYVYGVDTYWAPDDEMGCHWQDPALSISWPVTDALVSDRDAAAGSLSELVAAIEPWQPIGSQNR